MITTFNIVPGLKCNKSCHHCATNSASTIEGSLTDNEIKSIIVAISELMPERVVMAGGEPTLYINELNSILKELSNNISIYLTTNGWFAESPDSVKSVLDKFERLNLIQLSFDRFHGYDLTSEAPFLLKEYCFKNNIALHLLVCLENNEDIIFASKVKKKYDLPVSYQFISKSGRASRHGVNYHYHQFDERVLDNKCSCYDAISYIQGVGFSICVSNLFFNVNRYRYSSPSLKDLLNDQCYREISTLSFRERLYKAGLTELGIDPCNSSPCNICELIERKKGRNEP